ncbi:PAS domain S-box protein [Scytonema sp. PRP1]|uniref:PAS domain S-box protein n=1 Tax=Scytonema sp. PRP1 TaxID=3120513 RepID=UPI00300CB426
MAAKHYLARGLEKFAQLYMKEAHYCYERWGATAKVKDLETRYPQFFSQSSRAASASIPITADTISNPFHTAFDLAAVMKASQAISREIELKQLLRSLMQTLIENAGAQTGYLILENSGEWSIEAACELNADENACATQVLQSIPIADQLPESIIQYVIRTLKSVTLNDATREGAFINEPYIQQNQPQSVFCLPLLNQAKLVGVLYLENRLATGVFTPERSQVLQLLSTQAAIAIENANLYSELQAKESKIAQFLEAIPVGIAIVDATGCPYYANQCGNQLLGKDTDTSIAPEQLSEAYQLYVAGTDQIYPAESLPIVQALRGERIRTEDIEIRRDHASILLEARGTPVFDQQGNITHAIATFQDITERKQAEKLLADYNCTLEQQVAERTAALRQSEAKFRTIFENSQVGIYRTRLSDGLILNANQRLANLLGFDSPEEIIGLEHSANYFVNPSDRQHAIEVMKRDGELQSFEVQMRKRDGTLFWGLTSSYLNAADGYVEGVVADISDRKQAESALQISEERLRLALTASNQGLYDLNIETEEVVVNPEYALMLGYDPATFYETKSSWIESLHPDDRESVVAAYDACITGEVPSYQAEYRHRTQDSQWKWVFAVGKIVAWNEFGEPTRALGVVTDIEDRKQAEEALQVSESKLRTLIEAIPDPLFVFSAEGRFLEIMVLEPDLLWHPFEEMIGKTMHQLGREEADEFLGYIQQVLRTQQILTVEYGAFLNGREMWFSARIAPISHDQVIWLVRDITAQKQAEEASILEERNRMAREIHDTLAQSFTGILAQVGAAKQVLTDDVEATQAHLDLIKELARTGLTEARRSVVALRPQLLEEGSLQSALHRLIAQIRTAAMDTTLHYEIEGAVYSLPTEVESNLLRMGQEALTNAIRHANADEVRVQLVYDRDQFCLRVKDNGQGFGVGNIPASEGFGLLGMSERAERIGAQLTIRSQPGQGTEIIVTVNRK